MSSEVRFFHNQITTLPPLDCRSELLRSLERINTYNPPVHTCSTGWSFNGFYCGPTSVALLFYKLSLIYPDFEFKEQSLLDWANDYLKLSQYSCHKPPDPNHCGIANETLAYHALTSVVNNDPSLAIQICVFEKYINTSIGSNEWLYGRAGYLYILRLCRTHFEKQTGMQKAVTLLDNTIQRTVEYILSIPRPWMWHGKEYLGAVHGYIGIVAQIILSLPRDRITQAKHTIEDILNHLLDTQLDSGNFASSAEKLGSGKDDRLVQFCHGSPGFLQSFRSVSHCFSSELQTKIEKSAQRARDDVWERGLLTKVPCLCHGIAGNALTFADAKDTRFEVFLAHMTSDQLERHNSTGTSFGSGKDWLHDAGRTDDFAGLFTGEAGRAWLWAIADQKLPRTCLGYNDV